MQDHPQRHRHFWDTPWSTSATPSPPPPLLPIDGAPSVPFQRRLSSTESSSSSFSSSSSSSPPSSTPGVVEPAAANVATPTPPPPLLPLTLSTAPTIRTSEDGDDNLTYGQRLSLSVDARIVKPIVASGIIVQEPEEQPSPSGGLARRTSRRSLGPPSPKGSPRALAPTRPASIGASMLFPLPQDPNHLSAAPTTPLTFPRSTTPSRFRSRESLNLGGSASPNRELYSPQPSHHHLSVSPILNALQIDRPHSPGQHGTDVPFPVRVVDSMGLRSESPTLLELDGRLPPPSPTRSEFNLYFRNWDPSRHSRLKSRSWASILETQNLLSQSVHEGLDSYSTSPFLSFPVSSDLSPKLLPFVPHGEERRTSFALSESGSRRSTESESRPILSEDSRGTWKGGMVGVFSKHSGETPNRTSTPSPRKSPHSSFFTSPVRDDPPALLSPVKVDEATPATPAKERYSPLHPDSGRTQATSSAVSPLSTADVDCVAGRYKVVKTVGVGSFSKVKLATDTRDGKLVALKLTSRKMIATSSRVKSGVESEMEIMKSLKHENIVSVIERIDLPDHVCVALEFVGGGELFDYIADHREKLTLPEVARLFGELLSAVNYLHEHLICHRDLKIENVLLTLSDPLHVKLIDFAFACRLKPLPETATSAETGTAADHRRPLGYLPPVELLTARCGSEEYTAPEVILQQPYDGRRTDAWALGVILFAMLTGELPFTLEPGQRPRAFYKRIAMAEYRFPDALHGNEDNKRSSGEGIEDVRLQKAQDLVKKILVTSAKTRLTVKEMLVHPFLN